MGDVTHITASGVLSNDLDCSNVATKLVNKDVNRATDFNCSTFYEGGNKFNRFVVHNTESKHCLQENPTGYL